MTAAQLIVKLQALPADTQAKDVYFSDGLHLPFKIDHVWVDPVDKTVGLS